MKFLLELFEKLLHELLEDALEDAFRERIKNWMLAAFYFAALLLMYSGFFAVELQAGNRWLAVALPILWVALTFLLWFFLYDRFIDLRLLKFLDNDLGQHYAFCVLLYLVLIGPYVLVLCLVEKDLASVGRFAVVTASLMAAVPPTFLLVQGLVFLPGFVQVAFWIAFLVLAYFASEYWPDDPFTLMALVEKYQAVGLRGNQ